MEKKFKKLENTKGYYRTIKKKPKEAMITVLFCSYFKSGMWSKISY